MTLGRRGEEIVAARLGFERVPASGAVWPWKEDLVKEERRGKVLVRIVAQVKTSTGKSFLRAWEQLAKHARADGATPEWYDVVVEGRRAYIFRRELVDTVEIGVGGEL